METERYFLLVHLNNAIALDLLLKLIPLDNYKNNEAR